MIHFAIPALLFAHLTIAQVIIIAEPKTNVTILSPKSICTFDTPADGVKLDRKELDAAVGELKGSITDLQFGALSAALSHSKIKDKKEAAMFMAHIWHNSAGLKEKRELYCMVDLERCKEPYKGALPGRVYYGRGYMSLATEGNYREASQALFKDDRLLKNPELVAEDECISWRVAIFFWERNVQDAAKSGKFGETTKRVNSAECASGDKAANDIARRRFGYYKVFLKAFGVKEEEAKEEGCY